VSVASRPDTFPSGGNARAIRRPNDRFTMLANAFVRDPEIRPAAFRVAVFVMSHDTTWQMSQGSIAKALQLDAGTVRKAFAELEVLGYLRRVPQTLHTGRQADLLVLSHERLTDDEWAAELDVFAGESPSGKTPAGESPSGKTPVRKKTNSSEDHLGKNTSDAAASGALFEVEEVKKPEPKVPTINQRANVLAAAHYGRLGKMGNVPAFAKIAKQALVHDWPDDAVDKAMAYIAENNWTLTAERLANTLRGGPKPPSRPAPARPSNGARVVGNQLLEF
jgi:hypothetical protein